MANKYKVRGKQSQEQDRSWMPDHEYFDARYDDAEDEDQVDYHAISPLDPTYNEGRLLPAGYGNNYGGDDEFIEMDGDFYDC